MTSFKQLSLAAALAVSVLAPAMAAPQTYVVDSSHTFPRFSYSHFGYSTQLSSFKQTTGKVVFDAQAKTGSVDISIDTRSVNTGFDDFNGHIQGEDFLDTAKFPTATFKCLDIVGVLAVLCRCELDCLATAPLANFVECFIARINVDQRIPGREQLPDSPIESARVDIIHAYFDATNRPSPQNLHRLFIRRLLIGRYFPQLIFDDPPNRRQQLPRCALHQRNVCILDDAAEILLHIIQP